MISKPMQDALEAISAMPRHAPLPWRAGKDGRSIEARMESGEWKTITILRATKPLDAKANAAFILCAVRDMDKAREVIGAMLEALEDCLKREGLNFSTEFEAEHAINRAKAFLGQRG